MARKKRFEDLFARYPNRKLVDGTLEKISGSAVKIYLVIAAHRRYRSSWSFITYKTIRKYSGVSSGSRIRECIQELADAGLIETKVVPRQRADKSEGEYTRRWYKVL